MDILSSFSQLILAIALVLNTMLVFLVYRSNRKSATNIIFVFLSLAISMWLVIIRLATTLSSPEMILAYTRLTVFFAVPQSVLFFLLAHTMPSDNLLLKKSRFYLLMTATVWMMFFTLSPFVFKDVQIQHGNIQSIPGIGMPLFAGFTSFFSLAAIYVLVRKIKNSKGDIKQQLKFMMRGILLMLGLIISTIMIPVMFFQNQMFIPLSPLYALIFLGMTAYAIVKFQLFNLKVIAAEALTVILSIALLAKSFTAISISERVVDIFIFLTALIFGVLLVKSVRSEVKQREQLEKLSIELSKVNEQLKILDQARAEFITIASHQLRTPPATIKWYLASIIDGDYGKLPREVKDQLQKTMFTNNSMIALIDDLLNASRIERGKMEFNYEPTDLVAITQMTFDQLLPQAEMKKLNMVFHKPRGQFPIISADKEKLRQVINNFIDNAIKYTQKGKVEVELSQTKTDVMVKVKDTGRGVAIDQISHVFNKFDRGKTAASNSTGLGLGLYVAKVVIEQHKGKIWMQSSGEGRGSSFIFTIPINNQLENDVFDLAKGQKAAK